MYIGYVYPAGGQRGTSVDVRFGGEDIYGSTAALVTGSGVTARIVNSRDPAEGRNQDKKKQLKKKGAVIDEIVRVKVTIAPDAAPGNREIRLVAPDGLSNPLVFQVGQWGEVNKPEQKLKRAMPISLSKLPVTVNGQLLAGESDQYRFNARKGQHLVMETSARALIPYLADAVPGWFQAVLSLSDAQGQELAFVDDYRFNPDPVMFFDVPADGEYRLTIRDSIYRGRQDFVYRIKIGEFPFITSVFPLGAPRGDNPVRVALTGMNLPADTALVDVSANAQSGNESTGPRGRGPSGAQDALSAASSGRDGGPAVLRLLPDSIPGVTLLSVVRDGWVASPVPFAVGSLPEVMEDAQASAQKDGQRVTMPVVVNGRIGAAGETDAFRFDGRKGDTVRLVVQARRLGSPLDSFLTLSNRRGEKLGSNDDVKDPTQGLLTHQADSELELTLPENGSYVAQVGDTEGKGGREYAYRLSVAPSTPDFALRAVPSSLSLGAGGSAPFTVQVLRRGGFAGDVVLYVDPDSAPGCRLEGGLIWASNDSTRVTLFVPETIGTNVVTPRFYGTALIGGERVNRPVVPAEDRMQAFIYKHLVPSAVCMVSVPKPAPFRVETVMGPSGYLALPQGKETTFTVKVTRRPGFSQPLRFELSDPPKGMTLRRGNVGPGKDIGYLTIRTESKVEQTVKGNLILTAVMMLDPPPSKDGGSKPGGAPATGIATRGMVTNVVAKTPTTNAPAKSAGPPAGGKGNFVQRERVSVSLPALPFRVVENSEKKTDAGTTVKK